MAEKILIIEDEMETIDFLKECLGLEGYEVSYSTVGKEGLQKIKKESPNLVLLDLGLPDIDGLEVCKNIKQNAETRTIPIIMLTCRTDIKDKVTGLEAGADDYIVKPFEPHELIARIKAVFRRIEYYAPQPDEIISKGGITIDVGKHKVQIDFTADLELSPKEFQLLYLLMKNSGHVLEREYLLKTLWGYTEAKESRTVDVHIQRLRKKLAEQGEKLSKHLNERIATIEGFGYKFVD